MTNAVLANYLIGLREGLEATLVVSILTAYLVKTDRKDKLWLVFTGVGAALAISIGFAAVLTYVQEDLLSFRQKELFDAVASTLAVVFVTWMIFWMRRAARRLGGELRARLDQALTLGSFAVIGMAFLAVLREGLETALLFYAAAGGQTTDRGPLVGISIGVVTAVVIGYLLYISAVRINLTKFFMWTGFLLILVAAGILRYAAHDFQESGVLPGLGNALFTLSWYDPNAWYAALLGGMFNLVPNPTPLEFFVWLGYLVPTMALFFWPAKAKPTAPVTAAPATQPTPATN
jgi:high-affinity iron transporter